MLHFLLKAIVWVTTTTVVTLAAGPPLDLQCQSLADTYLSKHHREPVPYTGQNMVFFLHIPRTAGRTLHTCLLKKGTPPSRHCPKAYDHLRINVSLPNCFLLTSHDDFSVVSSLPDDVAVMSHIRDPVDRFLSAYEFAIEVASRGLNKSRRRPRRKDVNAALTEEVWPWSFLINFFLNDMKLRAAKLKEDDRSSDGDHWIHVFHPDGDDFYVNKVKQLSKWNLSQDESASLLPDMDPYNNPLVMPLEEFVEHPIAQELLHDGQTFQVLGITNYSHWADAGDMRSCAWRSGSVRSQLLQVALSRITKFLHVGTTDRLEESVAAAGAALHFSLNQPLVFEPAVVDPGVQPSGAAAASSGTEAAATGAAQTQSLAAGPQAHGGGHEEVRVARTVGRLLSLGSEFQRCARQAQAKNRRLEKRSLAALKMPDGRALRFERGARSRIPASVIEKIRRLNTMDVALHALAEDLLTQHVADWQQQGKLEQLPPPPPQLQDRSRLPFEFPRPQGPRT